MLQDTAYVSCYFAVIIDDDLDFADVSVSFDYAADKGMFVVSKQQISKDQQWLRVPLSHVVYV